MDCTFANGVQVGDINVCKIVTGELVIGKVDVTEGLLNDVALIVPKEIKQEEETKFGFYVIPYGFPMAQRVTGETISLVHVIKVFPPLHGFEDVISMYLKIVQKEAEAKNE